jgi:hypothetical protein
LWWLQLWWLDHTHLAENSIFSENLSKKPQKGRTQYILERRFNCYMLSMEKTLLKNTTELDVIVYEI